MEKNLTVADFFCGAGGFSEGFRLANFEIKFGLDNWKPAVDTFKLNHPNATCLQKNILDLDSPLKIEEFIPDTNIIVGSPPCVSFSSSNRAGKADKSLGIELIKKFLQIIAIKKHKPHSQLKYWLMENVVNSRNYLKSEYTFEMLGLTKANLEELGIKKSPKDIALKIDNSEKGIHDAVYYRVPQKRERFICGEFPEPEIRSLKSEEWLTLGEVIQKLKKEDGEVIDPNYGFSVMRKNITDHYYNTIIPPYDWQEAKIKKQQARYYGKMSFPENELKPSRTIMATQSSLSRESIILPNGSPNTYRGPTIREVASLMSFPVTYLFQGKNESTKYRLVGNAVCPKMSFAFAKKILEKEKIRLEIKPRKTGKIEELEINLRNNPPPKRIAHPKHSLANFVEIVPDLKYNNFRVELDNNLPRKDKKRVIWSATIHHATGKESMKYAKPTKKEILKLLFKYEEKNKITSFIQEIEKGLQGKIPPANIFQQQHTSLVPNKHFYTPRESLVKIKEIVDRIFPESDYKDVFISNLDKYNKSIITFDKKESSAIIPLRILLALYATKSISDLTKQK